MIPVKRFETWYNPDAWYFGFGFDLTFKSVSITFGPVGAQFNWNVK